MAKPAADDIDLDPGLEQMDRRGMAKHVRGDPPRSVATWTGTQSRRVTADELVDPEPGERATMPGGEDRVVRRHTARSSLQHLAEQPGGLGPERVSLLSDDGPLC